MILRGGVDDNNNNNNHEQGQENTPNLYKFPTLSLQNILDKFNPGARQLISAGKTYLKALHGKKTLAMLFIYSCSSLSYGIILLDGVRGKSLKIGGDFGQVSKINQLITLPEINL